MTDLTTFLKAWSKTDTTAGAVSEVILAIAEAGVGISALIADGPLAGNLGAAIEENVQGEVQKALDNITNERIIAACRKAPVAAIASEELDLPVAGNPGAPLLVAMDPLDGSSNIDTNVSIGTIFSIWPAPAGLDPVSEAAFLQTGRSQLGAGYVLYGPQTTLVMTVGQGTQMFTLDRNSATFILTTDRVAIPAKTREYGINASNARHWDASIKAYVDECLSGTTGARGEDTNMRWVGSLVADGHRILIRGGVYLYPADARKGYDKGRLRLLYECSPLAFIVEQAGGRASTGFGAVLDVMPTKLHQRVPFLFGSADEMARIEAHYRSGC
jgi:fructose-1,6-bisphosphatase I